MKKTRFPDELKRFTDPGPGDEGTQEGGGETATPPVEGDGAESEGSGAMAD